MKNFFGAIVLGLLLFTNGSRASSIGEGELKLSSGVTNYFIQYIRGKGTKAPSAFYVTLDGTDAMYWYCDAGNCQTASVANDVKVCESKTGKKCKQFAFRRTVKWKNGINRGKGKSSKINSKWSDAEIRAKLTELGFLGGSTSSSATTSTSKKKEHKKANKSTDTNKGDIVSQIKELKELLDTGIITQDEFKKAKKKLLN